MDNFGMPLTPRKCAHFVPDWQNVTFYVAGASVGKIYHVMSRVLDDLQDGRSVVVFDMGRSYRGTARLVGGKEIVLLPGGRTAVTKFGDASFVVYELEELLGGNLWAGELPEIESYSADPNNTLFVVNEVDYAIKLYPGVVPFIHRVVKEGASACVIAQSEDEIGDLAMIPHQKFLVKITRLGA